MGDRALEDAELFELGERPVAGVGSCCFFFNDTPTTEIYTVSYTLSLHDALPISRRGRCRVRRCRPARHRSRPPRRARSEEHTSELQSQLTISYAVFCLKKKIEDEACMRRPAVSPDEDPPSIGIDDEGDIDVPRPGRDLYKVRYPQHVRRLRMGRPPDLIGLARLFPYATLFR